ncbi:hypothetical protein OH807_32665 [Kitasatospora sp. NBC_01560]|uniref:hypothetical protein n=1 Tax=Kitasatospora sp. NBC_01560 TaxID=2975965 RepID=UPI00386E82D8
MIVTGAGGPRMLLGPGHQRIRTRCLARRGMLHSECESVEHIRLGPGVCYDLVGRGGTEAVWYLLGGTVEVVDRSPGAPRRRLARGALLLAPCGRGVHLHGGPLGAELLCVTVLPAELSRRLPARRPEEESVAGPVAGPGVGPVAVDG